MAMQAVIVAKGSGLAQTETLGDSDCELPRSASNWRRSWLMEVIEAGDPTLRKPMIRMLFLLLMLVVDWMIATSALLGEIGPVAKTLMTLLPARGAC